MADKGTDCRGWQVGKSLKACFNLLLENEHMCDVTFNIIQGDTIEKIRAHKLILSARSPVFEAMLNGNFTEGVNDVEIVDSDKGPFMEMLKYIYSEAVTLSGGNVLQIMNLGKKYIIDGLVDECSSFLKEKMTTENVSDILTHSLRYGEEDLVQTCLEFAWSNAPDVIQKPGFLEMSKEALRQFLLHDVIMKGSKPAVTELEILKAVLRWGERQLHKSKEETATLRDVLGECVFCVKYADVDFKNFATCLGTSPLLKDNEKSTWLLYLINKEDTQKDNLRKLGFDPESRGNVFLRGTRCSGNAPGNYTEKFNLSSSHAKTLRRFGVYGGSSGQRTDVTIVMVNTATNASEAYQTTFTGDNSEKIYPVPLPNPVEILPGTTYTITATTNNTDALCSVATNSWTTRDGAQINAQPVQYAAGNLYVIADMVIA